MLKFKKICSCTHKEKKHRNICSQHSRIKMVIMLKDEYKKGSNSITYYCFISENKLSDYQIIENMKKRLLPRHRNEYNVVQFYNNETKRKIHDESAYTK